MAPNRENVKKCGPYSYGFHDRGLAAKLSNAGGRWEIQFFVAAKKAQTPQKAPPARFFAPQTVLAGA